MTSDQVFARFRSYRNHEALIIGNQSYTYSDLDYCLNQWIARLSPLFQNVGTPVVGLQSDYSLESVACLFAVWSLKGTAALIPPSPTNTSQILADAQVNLLFRQTSDTSWALDPIGHKVSHPLLRQLAKDEIPGLILFTTGSSGHPKAVLHHVDRFLSKFDTPKPPYRTLACLLFDHVAGIDTLLSVFSNGGTLIVPAARHPTSICQLIEHHRIEVLPTSPTFLRLLCMANVASQFDLSSLKIIAYGSEPMTPSTLAAVRTQFPQVRLIQKYGSTEFGSPPSSTKQDDGLWIKLDDNSVRFKVIDQMLWIKTDTTMMGYLNAPDPPVQDGWFPTGDEVVMEGEWLRILGRKSDIILVGGEKVHPVEVETVIAELPYVREVIVMGEPHPFLGQIVVAIVSVDDAPANASSPSIKDIRAHCRTRLAPYKIPIKIFITQELPAPYRQKKMRRSRPEYLPSLTRQA